MHTVSRELRAPDVPEDWAGYQSPQDNGKISEVMAVRVGQSPWIPLGPQAAKTPSSEVARRGLNGYKSSGNNNGL